ncbi:MAG: EthD family reductase [Acidimicrobiales bacterium]
MITVYILYPKAEGSTFDMDYYTTKHMPMFAEALGDACTMWGVTGIHGDEYHAVGWANVESIEAFGKAMQESGGPIMADVPNYTTVQPVLLTGDAIV